MEALFQLQKKWFIHEIVSNLKAFGMSKYKIKWPFANQDLTLRKSER